jgi:hypothetical protein
MAIVQETVDVAGLRGRIQPISFEECPAALIKLKDG